MKLRVNAFDFQQYAERMRQRLEEALERPPTDDELAQALDITIEQLDELLPERRLLTPPSFE